MRAGIKNFGLSTSTGSRCRSRGHCLVSLSNFSIGLALLFVLFVFCPRALAQDDPLNPLPPGTIGGITGGGGGGGGGSMTFDPTDADAYGTSKQGKFVVFPKNLPWQTGAASSTQSTGSQGGQTAAQTIINNGTVYQSPLTTPLTNVTNTAPSAPSGSAANASNFTSNYQSNAPQLTPTGGNTSGGNSNYNNQTTSGTQNGQYGYSSNNAMGSVGNNRVANPNQASATLSVMQNRQTTGGQTANTAQNAAAQAANKAAKLAARAQASLTSAQNYEQAAQVAAQKALSSTSNTVQTAAAKDASSAAASATAAAAMLQSLATNNSSNPSLMTMAQQAQALASQAQGYAQQAAAKAQSTSF